MATGRTISASFLTDLDRKVIDLCKNISNVIIESISKEDLRKKYKNDFGKLSYTRDSGTGLGGGKLQRDALCTRGRQGKAPFSNRNLRWHPLVVAEIKPDFAKKIEAIEIEGDDNSQVLVFCLKESNGILKKYPSDKVHEIPERYVALPEHWIPHIDRLRPWSDLLWTQNSCVIPALEACNWWDSVETYSVLGMALAVDLYGANFDSLYSNVCQILKNQNIDTKIQLPGKMFPSGQKDVVICPVCKLRISQGLERFRKENRGTTWQPSWRTSKKEKGDDSSIQIMHVSPLNEK